MNLHGSNQVRSGLITKTEHIGLCAYSPAISLPTIKIIFKIKLKFYLIVIFSEASMVVLNKILLTIVILIVYPMIDKQQYLQKAKYHNEHPWWPHCVKISPFQSTTDILQSNYYLVTMKICMRIYMKCFA